MQRVLVLDVNQRPLMPCHPARARTLLKSGRAAVFCRFPFTIILKERENGEIQNTQLKFDTGAKTTGIAIVSAFQRGLRCIWAAELVHRALIVRDNLTKRNQVRWSRRSRKTRYRPPRFRNRLRSTKWIAPSLQSRLTNVLTWFKRLKKFILITSISMELVRFDTQALMNYEISGIEYQFGQLMGYEIREFLLVRWGNQCAYCKKVQVPLEIEHIIPKSRGGSNRINNLTLACHNCNQKKGNRTAEEFGYPNIQIQANSTFASAAAVNSVRWALFEKLNSFGLNIEIGTGGRTAYNRRNQMYQKTHWIDAVCVGKTGENVYIDLQLKPIYITAVGHGTRQICSTDKYGFPSRYRQHQKRYFGFQTGDMVQANIPKGKYKGKYIGRVACRSNGYFDIRGEKSFASGVSYKYLRLIHRADGYSY